VRSASSAGSYCTAPPGLGDRYLRAEWTRLMRRSTGLNPSPACWYVEEVPGEARLCVINLPCDPHGRSADYLSVRNAKRLVSEQQSPEVQRALLALEVTAKRQANDVV
jgi:hypothetical protein